MVGLDVGTRQSRVDEQNFSALKGGGGITDDDVENRNPPVTFPSVAVPVRRYNMQIVDTRTHTHTAQPIQYGIKPNTWRRYTYECEMSANPRTVQRRCRRRRVQPKRLRRIKKRLICWSHRTVVGRAGVRITRLRPGAPSHRDAESANYNFPKICQ